jgi:hypothetical protein
MKTVTLYTKLGCHLCDEVEATLASVAGRRPFRLERRYISEDPADYEKYKHDVPVVLVDGVEIARHRMSAEQLLGALGAAQR